MSRSASKMVLADLMEQKLPADRRRCDLSFEQPNP
jgi:hypothetical protein